MTIINETVRVETRGNNDMLDLTDRIGLLISKHKLTTGHVLLFVPGSTAGLTTIEYEPGLKQDFGLLMDRIVPKTMHYHHEETWNDGNGHSHIRASLVGASLTVPFGDGSLLLGTWQQITLVDFDNRPRSRSVIVQLFGE